MTLWVMNCRAPKWLARQLRPQHRTRKRTVGATVSGQERHFALRHCRNFKDNFRGATGPRDDFVALITRGFEVAMLTAR